MTYVYRCTEPGSACPPVPALFTVGFYDPTGDWHPESDHATSEDAAARVAWLNGGSTGTNPWERIRKLEEAAFPLANLDIASVNRGGDGFIFQRNETRITYHDVLRAREALRMMRPAR